MTKKRVPTQPPQPKDPWIDITPEAIQQVRGRFSCCLCDRYFPSVPAPEDIVPACYWVIPEADGTETREALGRLCQSCLEWALQPPNEFQQQISYRLTRLWERFNMLSRFQNHELRIPSESVWVTAAAEACANTRQTLTQLARRTGLSKDEIVQQLIAKANPEDLTTLSPEEHLQQMIDIIRKIKPEDA